MARIVHLSLGDVGDALVVLDARRRVYVAASRDESYLHVIHPRGFELTDGGGNVVGAAEDLVCGCRGGVFKGHCYRMDEALAHEAAVADQAAAPSWMRPVAAETELERAGARG